MKSRIVIPALVGLALAIFACESPAPTELPEDAAPSLSAGPNSVTHAGGVMDARGFIPGLPNIQNWGCVSVNPETGVTYFDECIILAEITGDLVGSAETVLSGTRNPQGSGPVYGTFALDVCHAVIGCGTFDGDFRGAQAQRRVVLSGRGEGSGAFDDMRLSATFSETTQDSEIFDWKGIIF